MAASDDRILTTHADLISQIIREVHKVNAGVIYPEGANPRYEHASQV